MRRTRANGSIDGEEIAAGRGGLGRYQNHLRGSILFSARMIINRQRRVRVPLRQLEEFLRRVKQTLCLPAQQDLTICLVSGAEMARLNRAFRGKHAPTDVLSFPGEAAAGRMPRDSYLGDIAICPETARHNARRLGRALPDELRILVLHGVLHLLGYDHETDAGQMDRLEHRLRQRLSLG